MFVRFSSQIGPVTSCLRWKITNTKRDNAASDVGLTNLVWASANPICLEREPLPGCKSVKRISSMSSDEGRPLENDIFGSGLGAVGLVSFHASES
ncbi:hypothetical protein VUR80DRAFT_5799 [Thermomyces stellatus]